MSYQGQDTPTTKKRGGRTLDWGMRRRRLCRRLSAPRRRRPCTTPAERSRLGRVTWKQSGQRTVALPTGLLGRTLRQRSGVHEDKGVDGSRSKETEDEQLLKGQRLRRESATAPQTPAQTRESGLGAERRAYSETRPLSMSPRDHSQKARWTHVPAAAALRERKPESREPAPLATGSKAA